MRTHWPHLLLALGGGVLWGACFGRDAWGLVSWVALVPLLWLLGVESRRWRLGLVFLHGLAAWLTAIPWIAYTVETFGGQPAWLAWLCLVLLAAFLALYEVAFAAGGAFLWRRGGALALFVLPGLWVVLEWVRGWLGSGFPWNLAAYAWVDVPGALPLSAWIGAWGISYLLVLANTGLALGLVRKELRWLWPALGLLVPLLLLGVGGRWGSGRAQPAAPVPSAVRIVQPNIPVAREIDWQLLREQQERLRRLSLEACGDGGALIVWPESAGWPFSFTGTGSGDEALRRDLGELTRRGCPVLFNSSYVPEGGGNAAEEGLPDVYNSAFLLRRDGSFERYDKRHLVPFGEYVPLGRVFGFLEVIAREAGRFRAGQEPRLLAWGRERLGVALCYEVVFAGEVAQAVREGATVLASLSNDAWYGDSAALPQHLRAARFRAAENRRPMVRAAITGISALIGADGRMIGQLGPGAEGVIPALVTGRVDLSPFTRFPALVPLVCGLAWALALAFASGAFGIVRHRRKRP